MGDSRKVLRTGTVPQLRVRSTPTTNEDGKARKVEAPRMRGKSDAVYQQLLALVRDLGPNARLPPVRTLCGQFGVSQVTVDSALARLERQRILLRRERSGVYVSPHLERRNIALVCDPAQLEFSSSPFWMQLLERAKRRAENQGESLTFHFSRLDHSADAALEYIDGSPLNEDLIEEIEMGRLHGLLMVGLPHPVARWVEQQNIPVVAYAGPANYLVQSAMGELIHTSVAQLVRRGCRRIALFHPLLPFLQEGYDPFLQEAFQAALAMQGLSPGIASIAEGPSHRSHMDQGVEAVTRFLGPGTDPNQRPDGIISTDDMLTQGMLMAFQREGIALNRDVHVATHANVASPVLYAWQDHIIRLEFDPGELVQTLFETLETLIDGGIPPEDDSYIDLYRADGSRPPEHIRLIRPRLIVPTAG